jgi:glucose/arabinose dehydrogenase
MLRPTLHRSIIAGLTLALGIGACQESGAQKTQYTSGSLDSVNVAVYAKGLESPWGLAFLPDGRALVTERPGRLRIVSPTGGISQPIAGVPAVVTGGQGGLLDVAIDPEFVTNQLVYLSYSEAGGAGAGTAVARGKLTNEGLQGVEVIWRQVPKVSGGNHFGSRLVFARDGTLFITTGERFEYRDSAQTLTNTLGKVVRVNRDGTIPSDNPFAKQNGALPEIWSYGHRNMQGATLHPETGQLWTIEHGAQGGDELNLDLAGKNYGWPVITWGIDYSGAKIGEGTTKAGMEQPNFYWVPSIAPSGLLYYNGDAFPGWNGSFFIGALKWQGLSRLRPGPDGSFTEERFQDKALKRRIRDVRQGPDGAIYLLVDSGDGEILRLSPKPEPN